MIVVISFLLDNLVSNFISIKGIFYPLFSLLSLVIVYPYNKKNYLKISFIIGLLYDITYTDTLFLNAFIFLISAYFIKQIFKKIEYNYISYLFASLLIILFYRISTYSILLIITYTSFDISILLKSIYSSIIINIIYLTIVYIIINRKLIFKKT